MNRTVVVSSRATSDINSGNTVLQVLIVAPATIRHYRNTSLLLESLIENYQQLSKPFLLPLPPPVSPHPLPDPSNTPLQEGEALFYRSSALALESSHDFTMSDAIPRLEEFKGLLKAFPFLLTIVEERLTTVAQVAVLRPSGVGAECSSVR